MELLVLGSLEKGIEEFNQGKFWHAHEEWEVVWKHLPPPEKKYVQGLIQACAAFHLILVKSRISPAQSLARSALVKLDPGDIFPRVEIPGLSEVLHEVLKSPLECAELISKLKAKLVFASSIRLL